MPLSLSSLLFPILLLLTVQQLAIRKEIWHRQHAQQANHGFVVRVAQVLHGCLSLACRQTCGDFSRVKSASRGPNTLRNVLCARASTVSGVAASTCTMHP